MDLLREWLGPTVEQQLGEVLEWRSKSEANRSQLAGKIGHITFDDDGSNLRIRSAKKPVVQIIKLVPDQEPLQACLSDSVNRVDATIAKDAVERHKSKTGKRLTDGTLGGFIQLLEFEIVATHFGSRQKRITLFVTELKALGANGSGGYGMPRPIEEGSKIKELIQKLIQFRGQESARRQTPSRQQYSNNIVMSQPDTIGSQENSPRHTQTMFATQAPLPNMPPDSSSTAKAFSSASLVDSSKPLLHKPLAHTKTSRNETKRTNKEGEALLSLLKRPNKQQLNANVPPEEHTRSLLANGSITHVKIGTSDVQVDSVVPPQVAASKIVNNPTQSPVPASIPVASKNTVVRHASENATLVIQPVQIQGEALRRLRKRISRRDVQITKDQEKLLSSTDSWLPAEPGRRGPVANLPISILRSLNEKADLQAPRRGTFLKEQNHIRCPEEFPENRRTSSFDDKDPSPPDSDSDAPVPDSEWPPSPARDQLPPDSSAENPDVQPITDAHIPRSSNASSSSRLTDSRRPFPLLVTRSSRNSAGPSPLVTSPSVVSNPARQGSQQQSRSVTPEPSASRTSSPVSTGATAAIAHSMKHSAPAGHHERVDGDESVEEARAALEYTTPAIMRQRSPGVSESLSEMKPRHGNHYRSSPEVDIETPLVHGDPFPDRVLSAYRASTLLESTALQSSRVHSTTEKLNGGHRHNTSSGLYSIPPSPESDLEVAAPFSLNDKATLSRESTHLPFPSTASQPAEPFTQVKQTPYVKDQIHNHSPPRLERQLSFSKTNASHSVANGISSEDVDHITQSTPSILEVSSSEALIGSTKLNADMKDTGAASVTMEEIDDMQSHTVQPSGNSGTHEPEILCAGSEYGNESDGIEMPPAARPSEEGGKFEFQTQGNYDDPIAHIDPEIKRKASELGFLSTNVAKRRKKFKIPRAFPIIENIENLPDPLDAARRYRQNFIISRKCSEAGKPQEQRLAPIAVSEVGLPELRGLRINLDDQAAPESAKEIDLPTLVDDKAQAPSFQDGKTRKTDPVRAKHSAGNQSDLMKRLAPSIAEPMVRSKSNGSTQGTKVGEVEMQSRSLPLDYPNEVTPDPKMKESHPAIRHNSPQKKNVRKSSELISHSDDEDELKDTVAGAAPYAIPNHESDDGDALNTTLFDQYLDVAAKIAGPDLQHNHLTSCDVDDATPGVQAVDATSTEAKLARTDESADQVIDIGADDAMPRVQSDQIVASDALQRPENDESVVLGSGSIRSYPTYDQLAEVGAHNVTPGTQHSEAMDLQPDDPVDDTEIAANLTDDEPGPRVNGKFSNTSGNWCGLDDPDVPPNSARPEPALPDHSESISWSPNAPKSVVPEADWVGSQPYSHTVSPVRVAPETLSVNSQEVQTFETSAIAMSIRPTTPGLGHQPRFTAVDSFHIPSLEAGPRFFEKSDEQIAMPQRSQPDANFETAAVVVKSTSEHRKPETPSAPRNIFDRFKLAYPAYPGDLKHFGAVCRKIKTLMGHDRMLHQFLWDDFIVRHKIEYAQHLRQCAEDADDAVPYEDFYKTDIKKPLYCNGLVTPQNLDEALFLSDTRSSVPRKRRINDTDTAIQPTRSAGIARQEPSLAPETSSTRVQKRSERRETIDLTLDEDHTIKTSEERSITPPMSSIPMIRRSLPWMQTNTQNEQTGPQRLRRSPGGLIDVRLSALKEPSDTPTRMDGKANRYRDVSTDGKSVRETWGVGVHDVLESRYYDKISPRHLQLMKDIANLVDLEEARRLIYDTIHSRAGLRRGASKAVTVADLETVLDALLTKKVKKVGSRVKEGATRMLADAPDVHQTCAPPQRREGECPGEWWKDDNTPFKSFAKAYKSIKPGNGNSFVNDVPAKSEAGASQPGTRDKRMVKRAIDPLSWEL